MSRKCGKREMNYYYVNASKLNYSSVICVGSFILGIEGSVEEVEHISIYTSKDRLKFTKADEVKERDSFQI